MDYASPVVLQPLQLRNPATGEQEYVIAVGVIPTEEQRRVADMEISSLDTAYSHYADGTYDGEWSGQFVAAPSVAERLALTQGETVTVSNGDRSLTVTEINDREMAAGFGEVPAIAMPLAELQSLTGLDRADQADQILVSTTDPAVESDLAEIYPQTDVVSRAGISGVDATPTNLPIAMALAATLVAGGIGVAFVATMMGLELTAGRRELAVLSAVGFSGRTRALVVVSETVTVAVLGGILGAGLGALAIVGVNAGVASAIGIPSLATITPVLIGYALVAAVAVGVCAAPYPLYLTSRTNTLEELTR
ncbi:ABC transporter permease [Halorubrum sp. Ea1]|nr:ABC transporter permease [Halorubrum sp. Ea1]